MTARAFALQQLPRPHGEPPQVRPLTLTLTRGEWRNCVLSLALPLMETNTLKLLGVTLRSAMPLEDNKNSKELRRLIVQLQRRQRELERERDDPENRQPH